MKVFIKNHLVSLKGSSDVFNEQNEKIFSVEGKLISPTKKKFIYDKEGKLLYIVRNKYWTFFCDKVLIFDANNSRLATIKKGKFSFNLNYKIEDCVNDMEIKGKMFTGRSEIWQNGKVVGTIHRDFAIHNDCYTLEAEEDDIPFLTALVIGFDNLTDKIHDNNTK